MEEYKRTDASPLTAAAGAHVDDIFEPSETREKLAGALELLAGKRVQTMPRKHSVI
ncbi:MAG: hypothetical protein LIO46_03755 [Clostridiales bacterium]|nr:hypothetical protein [Clostridiales bacterium]